MVYSLHFWAQEPPESSLALIKVDRLHDYELADFWTMAPAQRQAVLLEAIAATHAWHYERNRAYRQTVAARGVGPTIELVTHSSERSGSGEASGSERPEGTTDGRRFTASLCSALNDGGHSVTATADKLARLLPRLTRPTAQTFKSYVEVLGTPFPQDQPRAFLEWMAAHLSIELPRDRFTLFRSRYRTLEALLRDIERIYADLGLEILTSSGTSGRSTIMVRDEASTRSTVDSFYQAFVRYLGIEGVRRAVFVMPHRTRIAMARMAGFSVGRLGLPDDCIHFTISFPAEPDRVRIRAGRTFRSGWAGRVERRFWCPFMGWMQEHYVTPRAVRQTLDLLARAEAAGEQLLVFGGWVQLHAIARELQSRGRTLRLARGSLLGTGGGLKERYPFTPAQIRRDLAAVLRQANGAGQDGSGEPVPLRDVYGMAEGNWAAMQCQAGNYHIPPWIYAVTLDEHDLVQEGPDTVGLLAFFDPYGGGRLFPPFFKTTDQVRLVQGDGAILRPSSGAGIGHWRCSCGRPGAFIADGSIHRVDLLDEAGCAAQL